MIGITHNQFLKLFSDLAIAHKDINSFGSGDLWEYMANENNINPVTLWVMIQPDLIEGKTDKPKYSFLVMDNVDKGDDNLDEVYSDTLRIAKDIVSLLRQPYYEGFFTFEQNITLDPFTEKFDSEVSGWQFDITFNQPFLYDACSVNIDGLPAINIDSIYINTNTSSWGNITGTLSSQTDLQYALDAKVPTSRQLTINGTTYDLSADRSWNISTNSENLSSVLALGNTTGANDIIMSQETVSTILSLDSSLKIKSLPLATYPSLIELSYVKGATSAIQSQLNAKEPIIAPGTTSQYWRGDKTFQTLNTSIVTELTNLYYTQARFDTAFGLKTTTNLTEGSNLYFTEARTRASVLTGLSITGSSISATDSLLTAFGKLQNQINGVLGGAMYQGTWNATTNSPTLTSSTGTKGYYYVVSVAGSTNLDGITDWKIGDWAIFNGATWDKVDNTDAVSSVNGAIGAVTIATTGTTNRISVTGGSGLTPTIDISTSYVGQTSITTLGTIATGVWNGTAIANTSLANSSITVNGTSISLGASATITANVTNALTVDNSSLQLDSGTTFNGSAARTISVKVLGITNAMLAGSIAYSKLSITNSVVNGDIVSLAWSKITSTPTTLSGYAITDAQPLDSDLTTIAGLTATTDNFIVSVSSAWASRTPAQVKITLSLNNVENTALSTWAGSANLVTLGTITSGLVGPGYGGTGIANNAASTLTISGNFGTTLTVSATTALTLPTSGVVFSDKSGSITSAQFLLACSDETGTGVLVFGTSPTFTTQIITPIVYGSSASGGTLTIDSTSNATKGAITFGTSAASNVHIFNVGSSTSQVIIREKVGSTQSAIYMGVVSGSETSTNYALNWSGALNINTQSTTTSMNFMHGGSTSLAINPGSSISNPFYDFNTRARSTLTASTNVQVFNVTGNTQSWSAGTIASQYFSYFRANTLQFASASTATFVASMAIEYTARGSNATFGTNCAIYIPTAAFTTTTLAIGAIIESPTGATTNYSAKFTGGLGVQLNHLVGNSSAPTGAVGTGAGTSPSAVTFSANATDLAGQVLVTTGTLPTAAAIVLTVTFNSAYGTAPIVMITPANAATALLSGATMVISGSSTTTFTITAGATGLVAATAYAWYYQVIQ